MISLELSRHLVRSQFGSLPIAEEDEITRKLAMLIQGECGPDGPDKAATEFGYSRQRYYQLRALFHEYGGRALLSLKRGPKSNYRRSQEVISQALRYRFLDPEASTEVIAQKLRQCGFVISKRTVDRIIHYFGLQKKTLSVSSPPLADRAGDLPDLAERPPRTRRSRKRRTRRSSTAGQ